MASKIWRNLIRTAAAACFVAGSTAQAGGVFYQSDFDPDPFSVRVVYFINDVDLCAGSNNYASANGWPNSSGCEITLYNVTATLLHFTDATRATIDGTAYLNFVTPDNPYAYPQIIRGAYFGDDGELAGIDWVLDSLLPLVPFPPIGPEVVDDPANLAGKYWIRFKNEPDADSDSFPDSVALLYKETCLPKPSFLGGGCFLRYPALVPGDGGRAIVVPVDGGDPGDPLYKNLGSSPPSSFMDDGTPLFSSLAPGVPEPGSLALLGGALVAGWLTRRRKPAA